MACLQAPHSAALRGWGALLTPKCCSAWSSHLCLELARRVLAREAAGQGLLWDQLWAPLQWAPQGSWGPAADGGAQKLPRACCWRGAHIIHPLRCIKSLNLAGTNSALAC